MKKTALCMAVFALLILLIPLGCLAFAGRVPGGSAAPLRPLPPQGPLFSLHRTAPPDDGLIRLWDEGSGKLLELSPLDFAVGAVASEMPVAWPDEALKAQAVACRSYVLYKRSQGADEHGGWHTVNASLRQGFMTREVMESFWGEACEENIARLEKVLAPVADRVLLWEGEPAMTCYHAISCGRTEASQNVWGEALPYLQGVSSPMCLTSPDWEARLVFSPEELEARLAGAGVDCDLSGPPEGWPGEVQRTDSGYVDSLTFGGAGLSGQRFRTLLGLRSACFTVEYTGEGFVITTRGYGHGVGLSQYGAKGLALTGRQYDDILAFYFPGTELGEAG